MRNNKKKLAISIFYLASTLATLVIVSPDVFAYWEQPAWCRINDSTSVYSACYFYDIDTSNPKTARGAMWANDAQPDRENRSDYAITDTLQTSGSHANQYKIYLHRKVVGASSGNLVGGNYVKVYKCSTFNENEGYYQELEDKCTKLFDGGQSYVVDGGRGQGANQWSTGATTGTPFYISKAEVDSWGDSPSGDYKKATLYFFRCYGKNTYTESQLRNMTRTNSHPCYANPSDVYIKKENSFSTKSEVRGKKGSGSFSGWSSTYTSNDSSESETTNWNLEFRHYLTVGSNTYEISNTNDCLSYGYTCTFTTTISNHKVNKSLSYGQSATYTEKLSAKNSAGTTQTSSATASISKNHVTLNKSSSGNASITYKADCKISSKTGGYDDPPAYSIKWDETEATINYSHTNIQRESVSSPNSTVASTMESDASARANSVFSSTEFEAVTGLDYGESRTVTHSLNPKNATFYYTYQENWQENTAQPGVRLNVTYSNISFSSQSTSGSTTCPTQTVYHEAEALIETRTDLDISGDYTTDGTLSRPKQASSDGEYPPNPNHLGYNSNDPSSTEPKIFAGYV